MNFDELMKSLRADYLKSIPEKIKVIETQILAAEASNLRDSFHKLKGTGRSYGMPEVSELAEIVENICIHNPNSGFEAATNAVSVLQDIYAAHSGAGSFALAEDSRVETLRKLLQS